MNGARLTDYCIFQIHKNREAAHQRSLAQNAFGKTAVKKYKEMASRGKKHMEDEWLAEYNTDRTQFMRLVPIHRREHPHEKYIYMPSEESTKSRLSDPDMRMALCSLSTLMWSPFSAACRECCNAGKCERETEKRYTELYRLRKEAYGKEDE